MVEVSPLCVDVALSTRHTGSSKEEKREMFLGSGFAAAQKLFPIPHQLNRGKFFDGRSTFGCIWVINMLQGDHLNDSTNELNPAKAEL